MLNLEWNSVGFWVLVIISWSLFSWVYKRFLAKRSSYKSVLITGAAGGIGSHLAIEYAKPGVFIAITDLPQSEKELQIVAEKCTARGATVEIGLLSVTDEQGMKEWIQKMDDEHQFDLIHANAGISENLGSSTPVDVRIRRVIDVNLTGVLNTVLPLVSRMVARRNGHIVITSSTAAFMTSPALTGYCTSKMALLMFGECLYLLMRKHNVTVATVHPGLVLTNLANSLGSLLYSMNVLDFKDSVLFRWFVGAYTPAEAAAVIRDGAERREVKIVFPYWFYVMSLCWNLLPLSARCFLRELQGTASDAKLV